MTRKKSTLELIKDKPTIAVDMCQVLKKSRMIHYMIGRSFFELGNSLYNSIIGTKTQLYQSNMLPQFFSRIIRFQLSRRKT